jgi:hypothetical protein
MAQLRLTTARHAETPLAWSPAGRAARGAFPRSEASETPRIAPSWLVGVASHWQEILLVVLLGPLAIAVRQVGIWLATDAIRNAASLAGVREAMIAASGDDVYARLILGMLGGIQVRGPEGGSWNTLVFASGSSAVGAHVVQVLVNLALVALGSALLVAGRALKPPLPPRRDWAGVGERLRAWRTTLSRRQARGCHIPAALLAAGGLAVACGAGSEMRLSWSSGSGGEMALSMVATKLLHIDSSLYDAALQHGALVSAGINLLALAIAAAAGAVLPLAFLGIRRLLRGAGSIQSTYRPRPLILPAAMLALFGWSAASPAIAFEQTHMPAAPAATQQARLAAIVSRWPSVVSVTPSPDGATWAYLVNGRRQVIRGMGYNAITVDDTPQQRAAQFDKDFTAISAAGVNTLVGWSEREFDDVLMNKAADHGLGVVLPFELDASFAYEDPRVRSELLDAISRRVERYRNSPALRMWGLGNEVLHEIARARGTQVRWDAFGPFLIQAADRIHELDPNHPVVYRDAEDWYAEPIVKALAADGKSRPWFVYSMNFFTMRMDQALTNGKETPMHQALMISEFGPVGMRPEDRPSGYAQLWGIIRHHQDRVLGGSAYVWTTAGPEPLDRNFGLTDANGRPVDGSLAELASLYGSERLQEDR